MNCELIAEIKVSNVVITDFEGLSSNFAQKFCCWNVELRISPVQIYMVTGMRRDSSIE